MNSSLKISDEKFIGLTDDFLASCGLIKVTFEALWVYGSWLESVYNFKSDSSKSNYIDGWLSVDDDFFDDLFKLLTIFRYKYALDEYSKI